MIIIAAPLSLALPPLLLQMIYGPRTVYRSTRIRCFIIQFVLPPKKRNWPRFNHFCFFSFFLLLIFRIIRLDIICPVLLYRPSVLVEIRNLLVFGTRNRTRQVIPMTRRGTPTLKPGYARNSKLKINYISPYMENGGNLTVCDYNTFACTNCNGKRSFERITRRGGFVKRLRDVGLFRQDSYE